MPKDKEKDDSQSTEKDEENNEGNETNSSNDGKSSKKNKRSKSKSKKSSEESDDSTSEELSSLRSTLESLQKENKNLKSFQEKMKKIFSGEDDGEDDNKSSKKENKLYKTLIEKVDNLGRRLEERDAVDAMDRLSSKMGIKGDEAKEFFEYLVMKAESENGDKPLSSKQIEKIAEKVKKNTDSRKKGETSTTGDDKKANSETDDTTQVSNEKFKKMTLLEKSKLFEANPEQYKRLQDQEGHKDRGWEISPG